MHSEILTVSPASPAGYCWATAGTLLSSIGVQNLWRNRSLPMMCTPAGNHAHRTPCLKPLGSRALA